MRPGALRLRARPSSSDNGLALSLPTRRELAAEAFAHTAGYDAADRELVRRGRRTSRDAARSLEMVKHTELPYGENPHQRGRLLRERGARRHVLSMVHQHGGRGVTFNNIADVSAGRDIAREFTLPACVIVKHNNPCGVAMGARIEDAFASALACDPQSAFGGVIVAQPHRQRGAGRDAGRELRRGRVRARPTTTARSTLLARKPNLRILERRERRRSNPGERDFRRVLGGVLVQDYDSESEDRDMMTVVTQRTPTEREWGDLTFAWRVAKHVGSNAIVIAKDLATVGIGAGQMSRVDARADRALQGAAAGRGRVAGVGRVLPVRRRAAAGARGRRALVHPAGRREARRRRDLGRRPARLLDGLHRAPALPPLIRPTESDADVDRWLAIRNEVFPSIAMSRAALDVQDRRGPEGRVKLLAGDVGFAIVTPRDTEDPHAWLTVGVLERARGRGTGSALWAAGAEHLAALGVTTTRSLSIDGETAGARFLERRGFREAGRRPRWSSTCGTCRRPLRCRPASTSCRCPPAARCSATSTSSRWRRCATSPARRAW